MFLNQILCLGAGEIQISFGHKLVEPPSLIFYLNGEMFSFILLFDWVRSHSDYWDCIEQSVSFLRGFPCCFAMHFVLCPWRFG